MTHNKELVAPCGLNCALCRGYLLYKKPCPGCRFDNKNKSNSCRTCVIKNCDILINNDYKFCYECSDYPCSKFKNLNKRYADKYQYDLNKNLQTIKEDELEAFVAQQQRDWSCPCCGEVVCIHTRKCVNCDTEID